MLLNKISILILILQVLCFAGNSPDSTEINDTTGISNYELLTYANTFTKDDYKILLDSLIKYHTTDFFALRMSFTKTGAYSPYNVIDNVLLGDVYTKLDSGKFEAANITLKTMLKENYTNIKAHLLSGYVYKQLNDSLMSDFHYNIYDGLIKSIAESGDGRTEKTAFIVINSKEEYYLLDAYGMNSGEQSLLNSNGHSFDKIKSEERDTGTEYEIYFNIDLQMEFLSNEFKDKQ